jgi:hypothetical protein
MAVHRLPGPAAIVQSRAGLKPDGADCIPSMEVHKAGENFNFVSRTARSTNAGDGQYAIRRG